MKMSQVFLPLGVVLMLASAAAISCEKCGGTGVVEEYESTGQAYSTYDYAALKARQLNDQITSQALASPMTGGTSSRILTGWKVAPHSDGTFIVVRPQSIRCSCGRKTSDKTAPRQEPMQQGKLTELILTDGKSLMVKSVMVFGDSAQYTLPDGTKETNPANTIREWRQEPMQQGKLTELILTDGKSLMVKSVMVFGDSAQYTLTDGTKETIPANTIRERRSVATAEVDPASSRDAASKKSTSNVFNYDSELRRLRVQEADERKQVWAGYQRSAGWSKTAKTINTSGVGSSKGVTYNQQATRDVSAAERSRDAKLRAIDSKYAALYKELEDRR